MFNVAGIYLCYLNDYQVFGPPWRSRQRVRLLTYRSLVRIQREELFSLGFTTAAAGLFSNGCDSRKRKPRQSPRDVVCRCCCCVVVVANFLKTKDASRRIFQLAESLLLCVQR